MYQGVGFAIVQGPLSRFGDTAANALLISLLDSFDPSGNIPIIMRTALASIAAGGWRILIMPIDTAKTCMQVHGDKGIDILRERLKKDGVPTLYLGRLNVSNYKYDTNNSLRYFVAPLLCI